MSICIQIILSVMVIQVAETWPQNSIFNAKNPQAQEINISPEVDVYNSSNVTNQTAEEILLRGFCQDRLSSGRCSNVDCYPCSTRSCTMGTCCLQTLTEAAPDAGKHTGCMANQVIGIVLCPEDWPEGNDTTRQACETGTGRFTFDEPVSDLGTNVTFRNRHCAVCHGISTYVTWTPSVTCRHFQYVYTAETMEELLEKASERASTCIINLVPPQQARVQFCPRDQKKWYSTNVIRTCNVTGQWGQYDADVEEDCQRYRALSLRVRHAPSNQLFQNLFCAECNGITARMGVCPMSRTRMHPGSGRGHTPRTPPLTLLLGVQDLPLRQQHQLSGFVNNNCSDDEWLDLTGRCHNMSCAQGKLFSTDNDTCSTAVPMIRGLVYSLDITFLPKHPVLLSNTQRAWDNFQQRFSQTLKAKFDSSEYGEVTLSLSFAFDSGRNISVKEAALKGWVMSSRRVSRDEVEKRWVENMLKDWEVTVEDQTNVTYTFVYAGQPLKELLHGQPPRAASLTARTVWPKRRRFPLVGFPFHLSVPLTPVLTCPAVSFSGSDYEAVPTPGISSRMEVNLKFDGFSLKLPGVSQVEVRNQTLYVCRSVLQEMSTRSQQSSFLVMEFPFWEYVLNMTVIPLSIFSLFVILVTYSLFPTLRTLPGLNMMGTCCTLLVAQVFLLLLVHPPVAGVWCTGLGVLVHHFWLSTFCWTFVSSLHMFRTFSSSTPTAHKERNLRTWLKNLLLANVLPLAVIALVIVVSFLTSGGSSIGYSAAVCYLTTPWLVGLSMILPLCLIVLVNIVLFILTVRRIQQVVKLHAHVAGSAENGHQHVKACFRLSLLTGATWVLSLVAEGLGVQWLRVVSVLINGGQGILLLLSYVTTRRVLSMMAERSGCRKGQRDSHASTHVSQGSSSETPASRSHPTYSTDSVTKVTDAEESTM